MHAVGGQERPVATAAANCRRCEVDGEIWTARDSERSVGAYVVRDRGTSGRRLMGRSTSTVGSNLAISSNVADAWFAPACWD